MTAVAFDTLAYAKRLQEAGMESKLAEAQAQALVEILQGSIAELATKSDLKALEAATKSDLKALGTATKNDLKALEAATKSDLKALEVAIKSDLKALGAATEHDLKALESVTKSEIQTLRHDMKEMESRLIRRLGGLIVAGVGVLAVLVKLF